MMRLLNFLMHVLDTKDVNGAEKLADLPDDCIRREKLLRSS